MTLGAFDYVRARDLADAIRLLQHDDGAKVLAGGHSLIPMMKLRLAMPSLLVDICDVPGMRGATRENGRVTVGALTTHRDVAEDATIRAAAPGLSDAAGEIGDVQVRNRGTIGGACAHGDPAADFPAVMLALDARFHLAGANGTREIAADGFFRGMFDTAIEPDEVLTAVTFAEAANSSYVKMLHPASGYAVVGIAVALDVRNGEIVSARIGVSGVGAAHFRPFGVEAALRGVRIGEHSAIAEACRDAAAGVDVLGDRFASATYRAAMADVFAVRAIAKACGRSARPLL